MKLYVEISLIIILILLMYTKSSAIDTFVQSILGKIPDNPKQVAITLDFPSTIDNNVVNEDTLDDLDQSILDEVTD